MAIPIIIDADLEEIESVLDCNLESNESVLDAEMEFSNQVVVLEHNRLTHRDVIDAHPIDAITDLSNKLTERPDEPIPLSEIWDL